MKCRLCKEDKKLIKAHIIPRAFFKELIPDKGHLMSLSNRDDRAEYWQNGIYDTSILCADCDNRLGRWDKVAIEFFKNANKWPKIKLKGSYGREGEYYEVKDFDYPSLKLFFIATLWKMSVSNVTFYKAVFLGCYEEVAYRLILNSQPGNESDFSVILCKFKQSRISPNLHKGFTGPNFIRIKAHPFHNHYKFSMAGYGVGIKVDSRRPQPPFDEILLSPNLPLRIIEAEFDESWVYSLMFDVLKDRQARGVK